MHGRVGRPDAARPPHVRADPAAGGHDKEGGEAEHSTTTVCAGSSRSPRREEASSLHQTFSMAPIVSRSTYIDFAFATKYELPIVQVVAPEGGVEAEAKVEAVARLDAEVRVKAESEG